MAKLVLEVQTDRVAPTFDGDTSKVWLAVQFTPAFEADELDNKLPRYYAEALPPWGQSWKSTLHEGSHWSAHSPENWAVFCRYFISNGDGGQIEVWNSVKVEGVLSRPHTDAAPAGPDIKKILGAATEKVINAAQPDPTDLTDLRSPNAAEPNTTYATVPTQSLPSWLARLPGTVHPIPSVSNQHALLVLEALTEDIQTNAVFFAFPVNGKIQVTRAQGTEEVQEFFPLPFPKLPGQDDVEGIEIILSNPSRARVETNPSLAHIESQNGPVCASSECSRSSSAAGADANTGRVMDLGDQLIRKVDNNLFPNSARDANNLPQDIANAIDPLRRIEAVLPKIYADWLDNCRNPELGGEAVSEADLAKASTFLVTGLNYIAAQVLEAKLDNVGRFECPLVQQLNRNGEDGASARKLLQAHSLEEQPPTIPAAIRVNEPSGKANYFTLRSDDDKTSPEQVPLAIVTTGDGGVSALKACWNLQQAGANGVFTRRLELTSTQVQDGVTRDLMLGVIRLPVSIDPTGDVAAVLPQDIDWHDVRQTASLTYAAPFIEGLVDGRVNWEDVNAAGNPKNSLSSRLKESAQALLFPPESLLANPPQVKAFNGIYQTLRYEAIGRAKVGEGDYFGEQSSAFFSALMAACATDAVLAVERLGVVADPNDCLTNDALPLAMMVDQLRTFSRSIDDWSRVSGYGLMVRRDEGNFVSLGAAQLNMRKPLKDYSGFEVERIAIVDPVPTQPADTVGISNAVAEYSNAWTAAPMPGSVSPDPGLEDRGSFARVSFNTSAIPSNELPAKLPALSYGYEYAWFAHLIGPGGVLAPALRKADDPYALKADIDSPGDDILGKGPYLRTVGLGVPGVEIIPNRPLLSGVAPLAAELPRQPPWLTGNGPDLRLNRDPATGGYILPFGPADGTGLRRLELVFRIQTGTEEAMVYWSGFPASLVYIPQNSDWLVRALLELKADGSGTASWWNAQIDIGVQEDQFEPVGFRQILWTEFEMGLPVNQLRQAEGSFVVVDANGAKVQPFWVTQPGSANQPLRRVPLTPDPSLVAPIVLDGLPAPLSNGLGPKTLSLKLTGPQSSKANLERWIIAALFSGADEDLKSKVAKRLNEIQIEPPPDPDSNNGNARKAYPDPAVDRLVVELWEVHPMRNRIGLVVADAAAQGFLSPINSTAAVAIATEDKAEIVFDNGTKSVGIKLLRGRAYEVLVRGAFKDNECPYTNGVKGKADRFGRSVLETLLRETIDGDTWLLGPAATIPIEVATHEMPAPADWNVNLEATSTTLFDRRATLSLTLPGGAAFPKGSQYVDRIRLVPQRWAWRGQPVLDSDKVASDITNHPAGADFGKAFYGRKDNEIGRTEEASVSYRQLFSQKYNIKNSLVARDLNWLGGWNLWRFQVELDSRYLPFFADQRTATIKLAKVNQINKAQTWFELSVKDKDTGRGVPTPALALALPLTEALTNDTLVPPIMAVFHDTWHANDHYGDTLIPIVESVRHPYAPPVQEVDEHEGGTSGNFDKELKVKRDELQKCLYELGMTRNILRTLRERRDALYKLVGTLPADSSDRVAKQYQLTESILKKQSFEAEYNLAITELDQLPPEDPNRAQKEQEIVLLQAKINSASSEIAALKNELGTLSADSAEWSQRFAELDDTLGAILAQKETETRQVEAGSAAQRDLDGLFFNAWRSINKVPPNQARQYWPEAGHDPIRSLAPWGQASDPELEVQLQFPIMVDGPTGLGFDGAFRGGLFGHTSFLVRPALLDHVLPWTFAKIAFRRLELPDGLETDRKSPEVSVSGDAEGRRSFSSAVEQIASSDTLGPRITAECAVFEWEGLKPVTFSMGIDGQAFSVDVRPPADGVSLVSLGRRIRIAGCEGAPDHNEVLDYPSHGTHSINVSRGMPRWRVIASPVARNLTGPDWKPTVTLTIQVMIVANAESEELVTSDCNRWITLVDGDIAATQVQAAGSEVKVSCTHPSEIALSVRLARLSARGPAKWCQFTVAASVLTGRVGGGSLVPVSIDNLELEPKGLEALDIKIEDRNSSRGLDVELFAGNAKGSGGGAREELFGLLTRETFDISGRSREQPILMKPLVVQDGATKFYLNAAKAAWPKPKGAEAAGSADSQFKNLIKGSQVRLRFIRILFDPRLDYDKEKENLDIAELLFPSEENAPLDNPDDSLALILSISRPTKYVRLA